MSTTLDLSGLDKRLQQLHKINDNPTMSLNAAPLMYTWAKVIDEDNRQGVLNGTDKDGIAMKPVTYRPKPPAPKLGYRVGKPPALRTTKGLSSNFKNVQKAAIKSQNKTTKEIRAELARHRLNQRATMKKGQFAGFGPWASGLHNNLTTAQYRLLGGPPLAPRDQFSRVITNLKVTIGGPPNGAPNWYAEGAWDQVVNVKGQPFLKYHFEGSGRLPRRDLRGVRPQGIAKAIDALRNWARLAVRDLFS